jgi:hypothetical protein
MPVTGITVSWICEVCTTIVVRAIVSIILLQFSQGYLYADIIDKFIEH